MADFVLYHGSNHIIERPIFGKGKTWNDYGQGFYTTENIELAKEWASSEITDGYINKYSLSSDGLKLLNLGNYSILHWLTILLVNREFDIVTSVQMKGKEWLTANFNINIEQFDLIKGYRADDSYFSFARAFLSNEISLLQLSRAMKLGKLGEQIMLKSEKAFDKIKFCGYEEVDSHVYYPLRKKRDEKARVKYRTIVNEDDIAGLFIRDIIRERITEDDIRLL